jgi:two-component system nitrogen regulation sensor histidine kinase GlnL
MEQAEFYKQLLENLSTSVLVLNADLRVIFINPAAQALLELSESRSCGSQLEDLLPQHPLLPNKLEATRESAYTNRGLGIKLASGQEITIDCTVTPVSQPEASAPQLILELHTVDRIMRINREEGLLSSQENTRAMIRGLAHEIKNPLGGVRGAAQLLARELPDPALEEYTNIIIEESDRLRDLVDRLLGSHQKPRLTRLNIHEILEHVRTLLLAETNSDVSFVRDYDPSVPDLLGDRSQLIQATLNIVSNAVRATRDNEGPRVISLRSRVLRQFTIGAQRHRLVCRIDIGDNGSGIPPELQDSIFIPMVSGHPEGSGLGLSISQSIINQHQGLIECQSNPGHTVFTLFIPLEDTHA